MRQRKNPQRYLSEMTEYEPEDAAGEGVGVMTVYTCYRCELQPCDIRVDDGKDERKTIPRILDRPEFNECPIQRDVIP